MKNIGEKAFSQCQNLRSVTTAGAGLETIEARAFESCSALGQFSFPAVITFLLSASARELLEPRLIGKKMNVLPILILVSVYAGVQVFGVSGVFLGPLYMMTLSEAADRIYDFNMD